MSHRQKINESFKKWDSEMGEFSINDPKLLLIFKNYIENGYELNKSNYKKILTTLVKMEETYVKKKLDQCLLQRQAIFKVPEEVGVSEDRYKCVVSSYICKNYV